MADTPTNTANTANTAADSAAPEVTEGAEETADGEGVDDTAETSTAPTQAEKKEAARRKKLKLKVDGREIEDEIDFDDEEGLTRKMQMAHVAQKRMAEYAQLQKEVREWVDQLRKDPRGVLSDPGLGIDLKQFAASIIQEDIDNSQKSPEQLEKEQAQKELRELKEAREKEKEEFEAREFQRLQEREFERIDTLMTQALETSDLPKSPYVIKKMADYMLLGLQNNIDVTPADVLPIVREEIVSDVQAMFGAMPEEVVEKILGKEMIGKLRKRSLAKAKAAPVAATKAIPDAGKKEAKKEEKPKMTIRQLWGI